MIEIKVKDDDVSCTVYDEGNFLFEATLVVSALVKSIAAKKGCSPDAAFEGLMMTSKITQKIVKSDTTVVQMPNIKRGDNNADD